MALVMVHGNHSIKLAIQSANEQSIRGDRSHDIDPFGPGLFDGRSNGRLLFITEETVFAGMWVQAGHGNSRCPTAQQRRQCLIREPDLGGDSIQGEKLKNIAQSHVQSRM